MKEIKARQFEKSPKSDEHRKLREDTENKFHTFSFQFIDHRCQFIEREIKKYLSKVTPKFILNFAWSSKSLESIVLPRLKQQLDSLDKSGTVYQFNCFCEHSYIGESCRVLFKRIKEHNQKSRGSEVYNHISTCPHFENEVKKVCPDTSKTTKLFLLKTRFKILESNLHRYYDGQIAESLWIHLLYKTLFAHCLSYNQYRGCFLSSNHPQPLYQNTLCAQNL